MKTKRASYSFFLIISLLSILSCTAQRLMENLDRGLIAIPQENNTAVISWRVLGTDPDDIQFNLYRQAKGMQPQKLNDKPITGATFFKDSAIDWSQENSWYVTSVLNTEEQREPGSYTIPVNSELNPYHSIPLQTPEGYFPGDASVGDLDGDGEYEIVLHVNGRGHDNSHRGLTDAPILQAYKLDGTLLWEINLGKNIREGAHYTQFLVYDFDSDGKAELVCKTADGTTDAAGIVLGDPEADWRDTDEKSKTYGKILEGPEFLTVFDGETGKAVATTDYIPPRGDIGAWGGHGGNGGNDSSGNRVDRFTACVAYLDGMHPSIVMGRGYYGRTVLAAFDFKNNQLKSRWVFDSENGDNPYSGQGNHNLSVADVDDDGKDEIIFGAMTVDDDGSGLYTTGFRHGDAIHVSDLDPEVPGLERFGIHEIEEGTKGPGVVLFSAKDGKVLFTAMPNQDVGRGVAANIDTTRVGAQMWWLGSRQLHDIKGNPIGEAPRSANFLIWWDGDYSREILNRNYIDKYGKGRLFTAEGAHAINGTKATPSLSADILGDWREELILPSDDGTELRIYTTPIPTKHRMYTLMHDPQYRLSIAWQNVGYNQPPHLGFYFGHGLKSIPKPNIRLIPENLKNAK
ncbi:rhamnogalacturonan lyase [Leeuwenhoekiella polynyae]|uniref:Rhamnogalacturonan endolyase n=1 Tax=Leeuwenhoekiella polynyae TaxID=1550906 RepID=A0A4Q0PFE5_9FLAO|nr:rhamnogalacturonan lyase [Leeuwenhoekiella polynyae]RXG25573.1 rhamnogalacturonan endolyase [Leeuwenhoekiella polynyae]